ncbi:MAG TPA: peptidoglycan DD-metalloendopeptidase family protein [Thermohalobaculum sp.]|nr:peptidoglycan DD-metalloendopeptidase family protein [Thermohalobaculum sp.]
MRKIRMQWAAGALALAGLAACAGPEPADGPVEVDIRGTDPGLSDATPAGSPGGRGVVDYGEYRVAVARSGDTVADVARRLDMSPTELAAYNGVQASTDLREGDELVLPPQATVGRTAGADNDGVEVAALGEPGDDFADAPPEPAPWEAAALEPVEVAPGEIEPVGTDTEPSLAPEAPPPPAPATGRNWSPDLAAAAIERADMPDDGRPLPPPPSAGDPLPPAPAEPRELGSPELDRYQTPETLVTPFELTRPVEGTVAVPYNVGSGPQRNEGVDFAAAAGAPVVAAEDGEVALVSESLGGLGTIVLVRHPNDLMTVYGRLGEVTVEKGDYLERGQRLGVVANAPPGTEPRMHFEVRRGADSLDPMEML